MASREATAAGEQVMVDRDALALDWRSYPPLVLDQP